MPQTLSEYKDYYNFFDGGDASQGHSINPHTGQPYEDQWVPRADYARVLAEFWADGPNTETPPGHWFDILNYVSDHPLFEKRFKGQGPILDDLEWDVKAYLAIGGAMHDAAVSAWSIKSWYDYVRPFRPFAGWLTAVRAAIRICRAMIRLVCRSWMAILSWSKPAIASLAHTASISTKSN